MNKEFYKLGLDLGVSSIGISLIKSIDNVYDNNLVSAVHYIPNNSDVNYLSGNKDYKTPKSVRRDFRSARNVKKHKKQVKQKVICWLKNNLGYDHKSDKFDDLNLLKIKGLSKKIELSHLSAIVYNYTKWRGYNEIDEFEIGEKDGDYKKNIENLKQDCIFNNITISQYYEKNKHINIHHNNIEKQPVVLQELYKDEFKKIWNKQKEFYNFLPNYEDIEVIVYYRLPLKSTRHLKNDCVYYPAILKYDSDGKYKVVKKGVKNTPKANPLFQQFRSWEKINYLTIKYKNELLNISNDFKEEIFSHLYNVEEFTDSNILNLYNKIHNISLNIKDVEFNYKKIKGMTSYKRFLDAGLKKEDVEKAWKDVFSISSNIYQKKWNLNKNVILEKDNCDYSEKALKIILSYMNGTKADEDGVALYLTVHEAILSSIENDFPKKEIINVVGNNIPKINENYLKNGVVTTVLNNAINTINEIKEKYSINEVRIELARELKNSKKLRESIDKKNKDNEKINNKLKDIIKLNFIHIDFEKKKT